jgi:hypothetical protein
MAEGPLPAVEVDMGEGLVGQKPVRKGEYLRDFSLRPK